MKFNLESLQIKSVLCAIERVQGHAPVPQGNGAYKCRCTNPDHEDADPSLIIYPREEGGCYLHCLSRDCSIQDMRRGLELTSVDYKAAEALQLPEVKGIQYAHWIGRKPSVENGALVPVTEGARKGRKVPGNMSEEVLKQVRALKAGDSIVHEYSDTDGKLLHFELRHNFVNAKGDPDKIIRPLSYGHWSFQTEADAHWNIRAWSEDRPLYGLDELTKYPDADVLVVEGPKTADAARKIVQASSAGQTTVVVCSSGGSGAADRSDWSLVKGRNIFISPDKDFAGLKYAADVVRLVTEAGAASIKVIKWPDNFPPKWDLADPLPEGVTIEDLQRLIDNAPEADIEAPASADPLASLNDLADNPTSEVLGEALKVFAAAAVQGAQLDQAIARDSAIAILKAKGRGAPTKVVDAALADAMPKGGQTGDTAGMILREVLPADDPVDGVKLLDELVDAFRRYIVLPNHAAEALALWVVFSYAYESFFIAPILCISSAEKRSGKTNLLDIIAALVQRPLVFANASVAVIFRSIEAYKLTLLIDEADSFFKDNEELRGILNAGHRRNGAVLRTVGDNHEPKFFSVWSPKAIALIGDLPGTLEDRSIGVRLRRASQEEYASIQRFKLGMSEIELSPIAPRVARWAADHLDELKALDPDMPSSLYGRAADNWRPLLAVADVAGGEWPTLARQGAIALSGRSESESLGVMLLEDLRGIFDQVEFGGVREARRFSTDLVGQLVKMEARPWPDLGRGRPITTNKLARLLKPYEIGPKDVRINGAKAKGYQRAQFTDAWAQYLTDEITSDTSIPPHQTGTPGQFNEDRGFQENQTETTEASVSVGETKKSNGDRYCHGVTDETPPLGPTHIDFGSTTFPDGLGTVWDDETISQTASSMPGTKAYKVDGEKLLSKEPFAVRRRVKPADKTTDDDLGGPEPESVTM